MRLRRSNFCFFYFDNARGFDPSQLDEDGEIRLVVRRGAFAVSVLAQKVVHVEIDVMNVLYSLARNLWVEWATLEEKISPDVLEKLTRDGILLSDDEAEPFSSLRRRHDILEAEQWHPFSALYYFMSQWRREVPRGTPHDREVEEPVLLVERHGAPPQAMHRRRDAVTYEALDLPTAKSPLFERLLSRRSSRDFDPEAAMARDDLATLLYYVWGIQGTMEFGPDVELLKKTSPSGGALHPVEVYPLVCRVDGLQPGFYHYAPGDHGLELLEALPEDEARRLAVELTVGQGYFHDAAVVFVMTARFFRNFWKYHRIDKALSVVLMDAAFLGQTFYLVAAELGLGALFTGAVNALTVEEHLAVDGWQEGPLAVCACGPRRNDSPQQGDGFVPYRPGAGR